MPPVSRIFVDCFLTITCPFLPLIYTVSPLHHTPLTHLEVSFSNLISRTSIFFLLVSSSDFFPLTHLFPTSIISSSFLLVAMCQRPAVHNNDVFFSDFVYYLILFHVLTTFNCLFLLFTSIPSTYLRHLSLRNIYISSVCPPFLRRYIPYSSPPHSLALHPAIFHFHYLECVTLQLHPRTSHFPFPFLRLFLLTAHRFSSIP